MEIITVNELLKICKALKDNGFGNKKIYLSSDDEGNDFHPLFYGATFDPDKIKKCTELCSSIPSDEINNIVLLG